MNVFLLLFPLVLVLALVLRSCSWARVVPGAVSVHVFLLLFPLVLVLTLVLRSCFRTSIFLQKKFKKSVSGRLGGTPPVGKNAFREVLAARSLPRHVSESILRRCWDPSWGSKFYFYVKKPFQEGSKRGPEAFLKGVKKDLKKEGS